MILRATAIYCAKIVDRHEVDQCVHYVGMSNGTYIETGLAMIFTETRQVSGRAPCYFLFSGERHSVDNQVVFCSDVDFRSLFQMTAHTVIQKIDAKQVGFYRLAKPVVIVVNLLGCLTLSSPHYFWPFFHCGVLLLYSCPSLMMALQSIRSLHQICLVNVDSACAQLHLALAGIGPNIEIRPVEISTGCANLEDLKSSNLIFWQESPRDKDLSPLGVLQNVRASGFRPVVFLKSSKAETPSKQASLDFDGIFPDTITSAQYQHLMLYGLFTYYNRDICTDG